MKTENEIEEAAKIELGIVHDILCDEDNIFISGAKFGARLVSDKWVSVCNDIPPENKEVLVINKHGRMRQASWMEYTDQNKDWFEINFTHWQPLPSPPTP